MLSCIHVLHKKLDFIMLLMNVMKGKEEEPLYCFLFTLVTLVATKGVNSALLVKGCIVHIIQ